MTEFTSRVLAVLFLLVATRCASAQEQRPPNVVIIVADDLGYRDVSCYGCVDFTTPHIDALAADGVRCTDGYVSHPYCSPSRAGMLTGKYQQSFGHESNPPYREDDLAIGIDPATTLLPELLRQNNYATGLIGKWHVGASPPFRPTTRGFTEFYGFLGGGHNYFTTKTTGSTGANTVKEYETPMWRNNETTDDTLTYLTDDLTTEAEAFIDRHKDQPFCLMVMYNAPHSPNHVTDEYMNRVADIEHPKRREYAALVQGVDEGVGRLRTHLQQIGLTNNTLVVFLSDNGGRRGLADNRPLRGNKGWLHEGGIRVPFILSMPGHLPEGVEYKHPVSSLDLLPTAIALSGTPTPDDLDGRNLIPHLNDAQLGGPHETLIWRVAGGAGYAVRHGNWKLVNDVAMEHVELYDLSTDLGEDHDVSTEHPDMVARLALMYEEWSKDLETPRWPDAHIRVRTDEREAARKAGTRQYPMPWVVKGEEEQD